MPQLDSQQFYHAVEKSLEAQSFSPLYFFHGEEPYLVQQAVNYLKVCALHGGAADFNFSSYYASDAEISQVRDEVETLPMMAPRRVIILREIQDLSDREWAELEPLFETPVESSVFILVGGKIDKRKKFFKHLYEQSTHVEFKKPFENQIPGWIRHIAKGHELEISEEAIQLLHRLVGNQLTEIESEIFKLRNFLGDRKNIQLEDVAQCVSKKREENVFDLVESIAEGDRVQSLVQLVQLLDQGQSEVGIVALVARHMRILLQIKQGLDQGLAGQRLANYAQVPSYFVQDYVRQAKSWSIKKLESCLLVLADTDKALKTSPVSAHIWLENLILKTCALHKEETPKGVDRSGNSQAALRLFN
ncbi:MAG: DNA polymerase III subunit delta [Bdellovibrio sp. CG10_big_fil_rev_8_21_14_0_10_47_8]|nr:MAG: DNA polymerase III subunit delta [Bdellovibrio sp. CG10_big_fil_rev_8_21_14_0_10_47_8]